MWILITRRVPVQEEFRPKFLGVYWAVPWIEKEHLKRDFIRFYLSVYDRMGVKQSELEDELDLYLFDNIHDHTKFPEQFQKSIQDFLKSPVYPDMWGASPNSAMAVKLVVNNEAVKVWGYEYKELSSEKLKCFVEAGWYELRMATVAEQQFEFTLDNDTRPIYDAALVDGCTEFEAKLVAMGVDIIDRIEIPPIGWYEYIGPDLGIDEDNTIGLPVLTGVNHERRRKVHLQNAG